MFNRLREVYRSIRAVPNLLSETNSHLKEINYRLERVENARRADHDYYVASQKKFDNIDRHLALMLRHYPYRSSSDALHLALSNEAMRETVQIINAEMPEAMIFTDGVEFHHYCIDKVTLDGAYCEFGVYSGTSINTFADRRPDVIIDGFDSFEGLPEDWSGNAVLDFNRGGTPPPVRNNVRLHIGWFNNTLPDYANTVDDVAFLHVDCDIYSSTMTIFQHLGPKLHKGSVIVFDEYLVFPGFKLHERKAFHEFLDKTDFKPEWFALCGARAACILN